jgi:superfamily II DNA or RNA helicase
MKIKEASKISLFPHNREALNKVLNGWKESNRVAVIHPTGTGKSYLILALMERFKAKRKLILAPTEVILEEFELTYGSQPPNTILMTYATLAAKVKKGVSIPSFDCIVLDEFHRCGAEHWGSAVRHLLNACPDSKILGTSATPIRYLDDARDMSDELFDGNVVSSMTLAEAIANGILPAPKYISALYTFVDELEKLKSRIENSSRQDKSDLDVKLLKLRNQLEFSMGIPTIFKKHITTERKFIVFCSNIKHMESMKIELCGWFNKAFPIKSIDVFTVTHRTENNRQEIQGFRGSTADIVLLFSIDILIEGLHVENTDGVILLRPTISPRVYLQQIGRGLSSSTGKQPLVFDLVNNIKSVIVRGLRDEVTSLISYPGERSHRGHSKKLDIEFVLFDYVLDFQREVNKFSIDFGISWESNYSALKMYISETGKLPSKEEESYRGPNLYGWLVYQRDLYRKGKLDKDRVELLKSLFNNILQSYDEKWSASFSLFKEYKNETGELPKGETEYNDVKLGTWFEEQKTSYRNGSLAPDRAELLLGFDSTCLDRVHPTWEENFQRLVKYKRVHHKFPTNADDPEGVSLGLWFQSQKKRFSAKKLTADRQSLFSKLLGILPSKEDLWNLNFKLFQEFYTTTGKLPPDKKKFKEVDIGTWFRSQKNAKRDGSLSKYRERLLYSVTPDWYIDNESRWFRMFNLVVAYKQKTGEFPVGETTFKVDATGKKISIGTWYYNQRKKIKAGKLPKDKVDLLTALGVEIKV